jgi:hypothetical protein
MEFTVDNSSIYFGAWLKSDALISRKDDKFILNKHSNSLPAIKVKEAAENIWNLSNWKIKRKIDFLLTVSLIYWNKLYFLDVNLENLAETQSDKSLMKRLFVSFYIPGERYEIS